MNIASPPPAVAAPKPAKRPKPKRSDLEFLAPALEILETPPSPVRIALIVTICTFFATALIWSYFGRIDIIAAAQGKFQPTGKVKIIQPLESGKVRQMPPPDGSHVHAGDILLELDASEEIADEANLSRSLASFQAEAHRRRLAIRAAHDRALTPAPQISWPDTIHTQLQSREQSIIASDLSHLASSVESLKAQRQAKVIARDRLAQTIASQKSLIETLQERVIMRSAAEAKQAGTHSNVIDATETLKYQITQLAVQEGQMADAEAGIVVLEREIDKTIEAFIADNMQKTGEVERQIDDLTQRLAKAQALLVRKTLRSPISGTVQASVITNIGQVVTPGQEVMRIVPDDSKLELLVYVRNTDIGFIKTGQEAEVKIESFPFTRYGTLKARVVNVATDAIPEPDANQLEGNPAAAIAKSGFAGAERTQNLVFPVTLIPETVEMNIDGRKIALTSGMAVTVEVKTDSRRILQYVFSPLVEVASEAMKER